MVYSAKVVIGDMDLKGAEEVVSEIKSLGRLVFYPALMTLVSNPISSDAVAHKCDVRSWDQQLTLFQIAMRTYNQLDIVIPNAGVAEIGRFGETSTSEVPVKPDITTLEVNLIGVLYSAFEILNNYLHSHV